ncbi:hypothetical protein IMSAGC013_00955 [Lachnospiraceae bacterium]|nr:hypothetical protein IMSAGC013_00955 [Lachnospiraceae bacterium]
MFEQYDDLLTGEALSKILKISMAQAYRITRSGKLKGHKEGKYWKIPKLALVRYVLK